MAEKVAIIDYGSGNLRSVEKAVERAAREAGLARHITVTSDPDDIAGSDRVILPGVGAFAACMAGLAARDGVLEALEHAVLVNCRPFLGVCVGMQLLATQGLEFGSSEGLGWIPGSVVPLKPSTHHRSPHMGWNDVTSLSSHPVFDALDGEAFYFAHSYRYAAENDAHALAVVEHGESITALIGRDNLLGAQFHPEKSQKAGLVFLGHFLHWSPS
ncbi:imidazole glycerol phosphate synthase subunit HisH [Hyphococcus flavus]|uniref:Imidazole glycerol phosphate synthase subunit HisH n=1 Tax=Hyphococcus flavus TaxID=1866326 RepID=A0AAE9ZD53_9PROT|nr:imidazole glycerol phosphate synthase subunit HisH [Hyphococcus flavus]WDI32813.1 imidazole glycerol phosphate synthase subunit HisH [Hyphococcus flavus]